MKDIKKTWAEWLKLEKWYKYNPKTWPYFIGGHMIYKDSEGRTVIKKGS